MLSKTTRELKQLCKEYYISTGKFKKSDKVYIASIVSEFTFDYRYKINVRKCFSNDNGYYLYLNYSISQTKLNVN